jgi:hypothetical protein
MFEEVGGKCAVFDLAASGLHRQGCRQTLSPNSSSSRAARQDALGHYARSPCIVNRRRRARAAPEAHLAHRSA